MANDEMRRFWNETSGPEWVGLEAEFETALIPFGAELLRRVAARDGDHVLDVGCGFGSTTLELARRVGDAGRVMAVDISAPMLQRARARAADAGLANIIWREADAQDAALPASHFDLIVSRFGVMFFDDPVAAFSNLAGAAKAGARLVFACWQPTDRNPWFTLPARVLADHVALPALPPPTAGPFAFGDPERLAAVLGAAAWTDVVIDGFEATMVQGAGAGVEGALHHMVRGPVAAALRDATPEDRAAGLDALRTALEAFTVDGAVQFPAATWIVSACAPAPPGQ
jgi:SAM-dependent methyltransferase